jgi:acetyltransferase-like isoleucine patch superfamily enzyme
MLPEMFVGYAKYLKYCGEGVKINDLVKMVRVEEIEIGAHTRLCDSVFLMGPLKIGERCDIQPGVVFWGGGTCEVGDRVSIGANSVILTGEYEMQGLDGPLYMTDFAEPHQATYAGVSVPITRIDSDAYIGCNVSIRRGVQVGEGAVIGMGSVVNKDVEPWSIVVGVPARKIGERPRLYAVPGEETLS